MTQRDLPAHIQRSLSRQTSPDALIWFLEISHSDLGATIRVVSDYFDYEINGHLYKRMPFDGRPMTDTETGPFAQIVMQNIDAEVSQALEAAVGRASVTLTIYSSADFDLSKSPRTPIGVPSKVYEYAGFSLIEIEVNAVAITGRVALPDYAREPWPPIRATQDRFPGLFIS